MVTCDKKIKPQNLVIATILLLLLSACMKSSRDPKSLGVQPGGKLPEANIPALPPEQGSNPETGRGARLSVSMSSANVGDETLVFVGTDNKTVNEGIQLKLSFVRGGDRVTLREIAAGVFSVIFNAAGLYTAKISALDSRGVELSSISQDINVELKNFRYALRFETAFPVQYSTFSMRVVGIGDGITEENQANIETSIRFPDDPNAEVTKLTAAAPNTYRIKLTQAGENRMVVTAKKDGTEISGNEIVLVNGVLAGLVSPSLASANSSQAINVVFNGQDGGTGWGNKIMQYAFLDNRQFPISQVARNVLNVGPFVGITEPTTVRLAVVAGDSAATPANACRLDESTCDPTTHPHSIRAVVEWTVLPESQDGASIAATFSRTNLLNQDSQTTASREGDLNNYITAGIINPGNLLQPGENYRYSLVATGTTLTPGPGSSPLSGQTNVRALRIGPFAFNQSGLFPLVLTLLRMDGTIIAGSQIGPIAVSGALVPQLTEISETAHFIEKKFSGVNSKKNGGPTSPKQPDLNGTLVTPGSIDADIYGNGTVGTLDINRISHTKGTVGSITRQDSGRLNVPILFNEVGPSNLSVEISDLFNRATRQFQIQVDRIYSAIAGNNSGSRMGTGKHVASESLDCHLELINHTANPLTVYHRSTDPNNPAAAEFQPLSVAPTNSSDENASKTKGPDVRRDGVKACHVYLKIPAAIANGSLSGRIVIQYRMSGKTTPGKVMQVYNLGDDL